MKKCPKCSKSKPNKEFHKNKSKQDGLASYCKTCNANRQLKWKEKNREKSTNNQRRYALKRIYGITEEQYNELLQKQGGCCAVCRRPAEHFHRRLAVDHDHKTLRIRGLLCLNCNRVIVGRLRGPEGSLLLANASEYLKQDTGWLVPANRPKRRRRKSVRS